MSSIRYILELILNPIFLTILGLCALLFCYVIPNKPFKARICLIGLIVILILLSTGFIPQYLTHILEYRYPVVSQINPNIHWVIVLSGGQSDIVDMPVNNILTSASIKRLVEGVRLVKQLPNASLLLSGGGSVTERPEAELLYELTTWFAVPKEQIILESHSLNTAEQAHDIKAIVGNDSFYLVTSAIHMPRAIALFLKQGMHPIAAPTDFTFYWYTEHYYAKMLIPNAYNAFYFSIAWHELLGRFWAGITRQA